MRSAWQLALSDVEANMRSQPYVATIGTMRERCQAACSLRNWLGIAVLSELHGVVRVELRWMVGHKQHACKQR